VLNFQQKYKISWKLKAESLKQQIEDYKKKLSALRF